MLLKVELGCHDTIPVLYKSSAFHTKIVLREMGQCALCKAVPDAFALYVLLPHTSDNLGDVQL